MRLFRVSRDGSTAWIACKTLVQIILVWTFALVVLPLLALAFDDAIGLERFDFPGRIALGVALLVAASLFGIAAARVMVVDGRGTPVPFDAASHLVVRGPYTVVRNPMALSGVVQSLGSALLFATPTALLIPVLGVVAWQFAMRPPEERFLAERFGDEYEQYRRAVKCWVPRWPPYRPELSRRS